MLAADLGGEVGGLLRQAVRQLRQDLGEHVPFLFGGHGLDLDDPAVPGEAIQQGRVEPLRPGVLAVVVAGDAVAGREETERGLRDHDLAVVLLQAIRRLLLADAVEQAGDGGVAHVELVAQQPRPGPHGRDDRAVVPSRPLRAEAHRADEIGDRYLACEVDPDHGLANAGGDEQYYRGLAAALMADKQLVVASDDAIDDLKRVRLQGVGDRLARLVEHGVGSVQGFRRRGVREPAPVDQRQGAALVPPDLWLLVLHEQGGMEAAMRDAVRRQDQFLASVLPLQRADLAEAADLADQLDLAESVPDWQPRGLRHLILRLESCPASVSGVFGLAT